MPNEDTIWRNLVNSLPDTPNDGISAPDIENFKKKSGRKFYVQKILTEIYVYTDLEDQVFSEASFQDLSILGEMSEAKLKRLLSAAAQRRKKEGS
jgi:hypothetical protein